jgi:mono/diheme cytochrome c family protein
MKKTFAIMIAAACLGLGSQAAIAGPDGAKLFKKKCAMCHAVDKKKTGPAVKDMNKDAAVLKDVVTNGRSGTMMKSYASKFDAEEIDAVVAFLVANQ